MTSPNDQTRARLMAHLGLHLLTKSARANLEATPDHSHSSLGWNGDLHMFETHEMANGHRTALAFAPFAFHLLKDGASVASFDLSNQTLDAAKAGLDGLHSQAGLEPSAKTRVPYKMDPTVMAQTEFAEVPADALAELAKVFDLANASLTAVVGGITDVKPGAIRCWPHHFDMASYIALEEGDAESAKGIGVGIAAGDGYYAEPYFYINPWPHLDADALPDAPAPGHWHNKDFVGLIATATEINTLADKPAGTVAFLKDAIAAGRGALGA